MNTDERIRRLVRDIGDLAPLTDEIPTPRLHVAPSDDLPAEWRDRGRHRAALAMTCVVLLAGGFTLWWLDRHEGPQDFQTLEDELPVTATTDGPAPTPTPSTGVAATPVAAPPVGESLEGLSPDGWAYPQYLPEGLELAYAAVTIPDAQRMLVFHDPSEPRNSGRSVAVTFTAGEPIAWTDLVPVDLATGDTWESRPGGFLRFVLDGGSVEVLGAGLATREVEDVAASLTAIDAIDLPRPVIDLFEDELVTVAETTVDGRNRIMRATSDGVSYGWAIGNELFRGGSSSCCDGLRPGESIVITGAQGPDPQRLEADGVADFVVEGLLSPEVAQVRIETDDGFAATVPAQEVSGSFDVRFLLAAIPIADEAIVTGTATALDATGAELGFAGFEMQASDPT